MQLMDGSQRFFCASIRLHLLQHVPMMALNLVALPLWLAALLTHEHEPQVVREKPRRRLELCGAQWCLWDGGRAWWAPELVFPPAGGLLMSQELRACANEVIVARKLANFDLACGVPRPAARF